MPNSICRLGKCKSQIGGAFDFCASCQVPKHKEM